MRSRLGCAWLLLELAGCQAPPAGEKPGSTLPLSSDSGWLSSVETGVGALRSGGAASWSTLSQVEPGMARYVVVDGAYRDPHRRAEGCRDARIVGSLDGDGVADIALICSAHQPDPEQNRHPSNNWWFEVEALRPGLNYLPDVGHLSWHCYTGPPAHAGDLNRDGVDDIWFGDMLYLSPHLGRPGLRGCEAADSQLEPQQRTSTLVGNIDVDQDGELDVIFSGSTAALVYYGPFARQLPSPLHRDYWESEVTYINSPCGYSGQPVRLRGEVLGPGTRTLGLSSPWGSKTCSSEDFLFDLNDRGREKLLDWRSERTATVDFAYELADYGGDWDLDGYEDYTSFSGLLAGPLDLEAPAHLGPPLLAMYGGMTWKGVGPEVTGDGLPEMLISLSPDGPTRPAFLYLVPSRAPLTSDEDVRRYGIELRSLTSVSFSGLSQDQIHVGDLDGNGVEDLMISQPAYIPDRETLEDETPSAFHLFMDRDLRFDVLP